SGARFLLQLPRKESVTLPVAQTAPASPSGTLLLEAIDKYLAHVSEHRHQNTADGYRHTLNQFYRAVGNKPLAEVKKEDFYTFVAFLRAEELVERTIANRCG